MAANFIEPEPIEPPFLCLIASGGHTLLAGVRAHDSYDVLGQTLDDAAGEALDKAARLLDLGFPGGPAIEREAAGGDPEAFSFPVAMANDPRPDFSFSGLKTALLYAVRDLGPTAPATGGPIWAAASRRPSSTSSSPSSARARGQRTHDADAWRAVALGGGVAANTLLRERVGELCEREGLALKLVPRELCTDNAAMIASAQRGSSSRRVPGLPGLGRYATARARR